MSDMYVMNEMEEMREKYKNILELLCNNPKVIKELLNDPKFDPDVQGWLIFDYAVTSGNEEITKILLKDNLVDPSANGNHAIIEASVNGYTEIVKLLLADKRVIRQQMLIMQ